MTSSRRPLVSGKVPSFSRTTFFQSGMLGLHGGIYGAAVCSAGLHDAIHGSGESAPARTLLGKDFAAGMRHPIEPPAAPSGRLPFAFDPAAALEPVEQRVKGSDVEAQHAFGALGNKLADFVAVAGLVLKKREDEQFGIAFFEFPVRCVRHIWQYYILAAGSQCPFALLCSKRLLAPAPCIDTSASSGRQSGQPHAC